MMAATTTPSAQAAEALAARNWRVLPCAPRGKRPLTRNGLRDATSDAGLVAGWWQQWPGANLAVATGDGLLVLDVDGDEGAESLHELERQHGDLPVTVSSVTGGGGMHYFLRTTERIRNSAGQLGPGLDVRGDGGYAIVAPSVHASGRVYEWDNAPGEVPLAPIPPWLLDRLRGASTTGLGQRPRTPATEWVALIRDGLREGQRNQQLTRLAGHLLHRDVNPHVALELVRAVNDARGRPPLPATEVRQLVESVATAELRKRAGGQRS